MSIWFTSDTHFGHRRVIEYSKRPFADVAEMDAELKKRWNYLVKPGDTVYHLGDFSFYRKREEHEAILRELAGQKHLITGNHDHDDVRKAKGWASVQPYREVKVEFGEVTQRIVLFHYRMVVWNGAHHGTWALHGHSHGTLPATLDARTIDVGVDCWSYAPLSLAEVATQIAARSFKAVDHHHERDSEDD